MSVDFTPIADRILVRRIEAETKTRGGILLPDNAQEKPSKGEVLAVGPGHYENGAFIATTLKPGDKVVFGKWSGTEFEDLLIMKETDVLGLLTSQEERDEMDLAQIFAKHTRAA